MRAMASEQHRMASDSSSDSGRAFTGRVARSRGASGLDASRAGMPGWTRLSGSDGSSGGNGPPDAPEREGGVATEVRPKTRKPDRFKVLLYNDDFTPMEFVVAVLQQLFGKGPAAATQIMLQIHRSGLGVAGVYVLEVAETKVAAVHRMAEQRGYPLRAGVEKE
jgi:ATP-dependent Clp protease adaptor protein ClpS